MTVLATGPVKGVSKTVANDTADLATVVSGWKKVRVLGIMVTAQAAATFRVFSGSEEHIPAVSLAAGGQYFLNVDGNGWFETDDDTVLQLAATGIVHVVLRYQSIT